MLDGAWPTWAGTREPRFGWGVRLGAAGTGPGGVSTRVARTERCIRFHLLTASWLCGRVAASASAIIGIGRDDLGDDPLDVLDVLARGRCRRSFAVVVNANPDT